MAIRLHTFTCGWIRADLSLFIEGGAGEIRVPVPAYLVEHPRGKVLFDSGLHLELRKDPAARLGRRIAEAYKIEFAPGQSVAERLAEVGVQPAEIKYLVSSYLHFDHVGGNAQIPNARLVVQKKEWEAGRTPELARRSGFDRRDFDLGHDLELAEGELDLFGDGTVTCVPSHGHTPGHQSLRVRLAGGEVVLTSDACYMQRNLDEMKLPPIVYDREQMLATLRCFGEMRRRGARLLFGHDPELWRGRPDHAMEIAATSR